MNWYLKVINQYVDFKGRARRKEYWMFILLNTVFSIAAKIIDDIIGSDFSGDSGIVSLAYSLFVFLPSLAVMVRRMHDVGKSGWLLLIFFLPIVGISLLASYVTTSELLLPVVLVFIGILIWLLIMLATNSQPGKNKWGHNPKTGNHDEFDDIGKEVTF